MQVVAPQQHNGSVLAAPRRPSGAVVLDDIEEPQRLEVPGKSQPSGCQSLVLTFGGDLSPNPRTDEVQKQPRPSASDGGEASAEDACDGPILTGHAAAPSSLRPVSTWRTAHTRQSCPCLGVQVLGTVWSISALLNLILAEHCARLHGSRSPYDFRSNSATVTASPAPRAVAPAGLGDVYGRGNSLHGSWVA